jgi:2-polyprenyl-6-methoxyphenol hydroxylase-like FAD-dependent oxidoreductase
MSQSADVVIVGAGLAGATAATLFARSGVSVILIDRHPSYPVCFKAEKIEADQAELLRKFGMFQELRPSLGQIAEIITVRRGKVSHRQAEQYGGAYHDIVNEVRSRVPAEVEFRLGRVVELSAGPERQSITLSDGATLSARLLVLASGTGESLAEQLGIGREMLSEGHSVSFGFSIARVDGQPFDFESINYYSEDPTQRVGYVTLFLFPHGEMRANLFTFWDPRSAQVRDMIQQPERELERLFPELASFIGAYRVTTKVSTGVNDLFHAVGQRKAGVVLVGDVYQGACPSTGTGLSKVLTDVDVLCNDCAPRWLASPGMGSEKIAQFYDSPVKRASDRFALDSAFHSRETALVSTRFNRLQRSRAWINAAGFVSNSPILRPVGVTLYERLMAVRARMRERVGR